MQLKVSHLLCPTLKKMSMVSEHGRENQIVNPLPFYSALSS